MFNLLTIYCLFNGPTYLFENYAKQTILFIFYNTLLYVWYIPPRLVKLTPPKFFLARLCSIVADSFSILKKNQTDLACLSIFFNKVYTYSKDLLDKKSHV